MRAQSNTELFEIPDQRSEWLIATEFAPIGKTVNCAASEKRRLKFYYRGALVGKAEESKHTADMQDVQIVRSSLGVLRQACKPGNSVGLLLIAPGGTQP